MTAMAVTPERVRILRVVKSLSMAGSATILPDETSSLYPARISESRGTLPSLSTQVFLKAYNVCASKVV